MLPFHHHPDQGLGAGGTDENAALTAQLFLPAAGLLPQGFIGHDALLDPGGVGDLHVDELLGILGASGGQLGGGDAAAAEGLQKLLGSLFRLTPPTAMIIDEAPLFAATQQFLASQGLRVPQQVSLIW